MNSLNETGLARQQARSWSGRLGILAATYPAIRPEATLTQLDTTSAPALPTRLSLILGHLRQQRQREEHAADKLRAQEFMMAP
jgi:hypothetical protein